MPPFEFPNGKRFAFTILDDTDVATLANVRPIYRLLEEVGMRTTKTRNNLLRAVVFRGAFPLLRHRCREDEIVLPVGCETGTTERRRDLRPVTRAVEDDVRDAFPARRL